MLKSDTNLTLARAHGGPRNNPEHASWNLPPGQAYEATREERVAIYRGGCKGAAQRASSATTGSAPHAAAPAAHTDSGAHSVKSPHLPDPEPKALHEIKVDAGAALTAAYKRHGSGFRIRVQSPEQWEQEAKALSAREGCDFMEAMFRAGFVHSFLSFPSNGGSAR